MIQHIAAPWAIELLALGKSYRPAWPGPPVVALHDVSLRLGGGRVLGLFGANGSGKSTLLKALAGLVRPTTGACRVCGHVAGTDAARAKVGYLPDALRFAPQLTGRELLEFCAGLSGVKSERVGDVLVWSGVAAAADRRLATYSRGMHQRIGLAQAILHDPAVVLLDEPANGLDPHGRLALGRLVRDLAAQGKAVVFSSHLLDHAEEVCDEIAFLDSGHLLLQGTPAELLGTRGGAGSQPGRLEQLYLEKVEPYE